ncbi:MAG: GAF domain-containing protein [Deltaproteobacteria bacterium]|nr:GAF domain-containing protein [Deltaproteobacteria bacterium]
MANAPKVPAPETASDADVGARRLDTLDDATTIEVLERELARAYRIERALRDVGLALGTTLDLDSLLRLILERTTEALEAERATLFLLENKPDRSANPPTRFETMLVSRVTEGGAVDEIALHLGEGIAGEVARTGKVANVRDAYADPRFSRAWDERSGFRTRSVLCVPLKSQLGRIVGVIQVLNKRPGGAIHDREGWGGGEEAYFDDDDTALLQALATQAAVSIEQARLFVSILDKNRELSAARAALEKKVQDLAVLFAIERATARATTRAELAAALLPEATRAVAGRTAYVVLADESGDLALFHLDHDAIDLAGDVFAPPERGSRPSIPVAPPSVPVQHRSIHKLRIKAREGLVGAAIATGHTIVVDDIANDPRCSALIRDALYPALADERMPAAVVPLLDENDTPFGALAVVRKGGAPPFAADDVDLLRLVALNASTGFQLERARDARVREERLTTIGSLLSGMMHDLKTPLTVISGYVQLMADEGDPAQREAYAELIHKQFDHLGAMQREILAFARGERTVLLRKVYLQKFFGEIEGQLRHEIARRRVPVDLSFELRDRGTARIDEAKLTRAIHNLARNAIEAIGERGGKLRIVIDQQPGALIIEVSDNGPGLPAQVQERLFQSFVTAGKPTGTGLGLAIVKKIAEDHGGTIEASSSPDGATFTLRIPQDPTNPALKRMPTQ